MQPGYGNYGYGGPPPYPPPQFPPPPQRRRRRFPLFGLVVATLTIGFVGGVTLLVLFLTRPRGERVAETNLMDPRGAVTVAAGAGDALFFRIDVTVAVPAIDLMGDDQRERQIDRQLKGSTLSIRAKSPTGQERVSSCPVYNGKAGSVSTIGTSHSRSGLLNACTIAIDAPGNWTVQGSVAWSAGFSPTRATLETRLAKASE